MRKSKEHIISIGISNESELLAEAVDQKCRVEHGCHA
jgi:hypothetical protein